MRIAINTRFLLPEYLEGYGNFLYQLLDRITRNHPEHQFIFIFDRPFSPQFVFNTNVTAVVTGPPARHPLLWKLWYDFKVPSVLKKYKADVFLSADGFCSLNTRVPQVLVVHDLAFLHFPAFIPRQQLFFYKKYTPRFLKKASVIATVSNFSRKDISNAYLIDIEKIALIPNAVREIFQPLDVAEKEKIKQQYTNGREYFIYTGSIHPRKNLLRLLKAFSVFKKKQKSSFKLIIAGRAAWQNDAFIENLKHYKYRDDVIITGYIPDATLAQLTAAAYALVYPSLFEGFGVPVLEAMRCGVPVITTAGSAMQEIGQDAALYAMADDHQDIAEKMLLLYKDERLKNELIAKGKLVEQAYSWDQSADACWNCILQAVNY